MYTAQQIRDYITQNGLTGNPVEIRKAQQKYGVSDAALNEAIGWERQTSQDPQTGLTQESFVVPSKWNGPAAQASTAAPPAGYSADQIRQYINSQGIGNDPQAIYRAAQQYGVGAGQIDSAMGYAPGTSAGWVQQQGLAALPGSAQAAAGGGMTLVPNPPGGYHSSTGGSALPATTGAAGSPQMQPPAGNMQPPAGFPSMGTYAMPTTQNMPWASPGAPTTSAPSAPSGWAQPQQPFSLPSYNPYTAWMADSIGQRMGQHLQRNILPGIRSGAASAGGLGGSRQGIAEGIAIGDTMTGYGNALAGLYSGQFNADRNYGLANDALDLNVYNANQNWMRQGQQDQLGLADRLLGWNQQYGVGNATNVQNTPLNYWQQFGNQASQFAGLGGQQAQQMQGNPYLGALGGAMTAYNLWKSWGG